MSKSLGNAIGIHEPPLEMYGKVMSISDEMMWRYYELLTDVSTERIAAMKANAASGKEHPKALKQELAMSIVTDFHSAEAAQKAGDDWARLRQRELQKDNLPEDIEEVRVDYEKIRSEGSPPPGDDVYLWTRLDRLLFLCGLADSVTDAGRKLKARSVELLKPDGERGEIWTSPHLPIVSRDAPIKLIIRVGKKVRAALIETHLSLSS
jgi:tyrosyl-tRNA synthetase